MNIRKSFPIAAFLLLSVLMLPTARATEEDQAIKVTFSEAVQIPGQVLPAGSYLFVLLNNHQTVSIWSSDHLKFYGLLRTINRERTELTDDPVFMLAKQGAMQPEAVVAWFYPDRKVGHQFVYPKQKENGLANTKPNGQTAGN